MAAKLWMQLHPINEYLDKIEGQILIFAKSLDAILTTF